MIKNVIFDLDGTLLDTSEGIVESVKYAAAVLGYAELPQNELLEFVGPPVQKSFMNHYGCGLEEAQRAADVFRNYYKEKALLKAVPYDGIFELCDLLKKNGTQMAVATYKREDYALKLLRHYGFDKYCVSMHGADNNNVLKKEDIVKQCCLDIGASKSNSVLVGDTVNDAVGAENASIRFIAVTYGFGFKSKEDANRYPNIGIANTPLEVAEILFNERERSEDSSNNRCNRSDWQGFNK